MSHAVRKHCSLTSTFGQAVAPSTISPMALVVTTGAQGPRGGCLRLHVDREGVPLLYRKPRSGMWVQGRTTLALRKLLV